MNPEELNLLLSKKKSNYKKKLERRKKFTDKKDIKKYFFVHIPKCAGSQISKLFDTTGHRTIIETNESRSRSIKNYNLSDYYYIFSIVRNPYDRFVSAYHYLKNSPDIKFDKVNRFQRDKFIKTESIEELINLLYIDFKNDKKINFHRNKSNSLVDVIHLRPMYTFICNKNKEIIIDKVVYFENMNEDINLILKKNNIDVNFIKTNASSRKDFGYYFSKISKETVKKFNEIYDDDFKIFGYQIVENFD